MPLHTASVMFFFACFVKWSQKEGCPPLHVLSWDAKIAVSQIPDIILDHLSSAQNLRYLLHTHICSRCFFTSYRGKSPSNHHFKRVCFILSKNVKQIQVYRGICYTTQLYTDSFTSHEFRIPIWTNQDFMVHITQEFSSRYIMWVPVIDVHFSVPRSLSSRPQILRAAELWSAGNLDQEIQNGCER